MSALPDRLSTALSGRYAIERELGVGGMATVYLARDLKHNRQVALKVLKPELAAVVGAERFLSEIQTTANLQHPNILPLYDSGEADSFLYYVMPYVEGATLRDRLDAEKQLPVDESVRIATAVANALDFAHRHGVVHRDIKPANILFQDGQPVVGDFGIALAVGAGGGARLTETGLSVGTPYYMSPEQATGDQQVGPRSDIYALGCVLYEMLVGDPPYLGSTAQAVLGQIIAGKPVVATEKRPAVPAHVDAAIRCALEKTAADRFPTARDFVTALENRAFRYGEERGDGVSRARAPRWVGWMHGAATAGLFVALLVALTRGSGAPEPRTVRFSIPLARLADTSVISDGVLGLARHSTKLLALSPDGSQMAYVGSTGRETHLFLRPLDRQRTELLPGTDGASAPFFSPDGAWIGFFVEDALRRINLTTRQVETVAAGLENDGWPGAASWGDDGTIVFAKYSGLWRVPSGGGTPERFLGGGDSLWYASPQLLPGSGALLFHMMPDGNPAQGQVEVMDLGSGERTVLVEGAAAPRYSSTGHVLYLKEGTLWGALFDARRLAVSGEPVVLEQDVMQAYYMDSSGQDSGEGQFSLSRSGDMVYLRGGVMPEDSLVVQKVGPSGVVGTLDLAPRGYHFFRYSPDGSRLAFHSGPGRHDEIGIYTFATDVTQMLRLNGFMQMQPLWSPDGAFLVFFGDVDGVTGIYRIASDGASRPERLLGERAGVDVEAFDWSRDGVLVFGDEGDLWTLDPDDMAERFFVSEADEADASFSPDGKWIAYVAMSPGDAPPEVLVRPYPGPDPAVQISSGFGINPAWSRDGRTLYYRGRDSTGQGVIMAVELDVSAGLRPGRPRVFIPDWNEIRWPLRGYDVAPDGSLLRYVSAPGVEPERFEDIQVVLGFGAELKRRIPN